VQAIYLEIDLQLFHNLEDKAAWQPFIAEEQFGANNNIMAFNFPNLTSVDQADISDRVATMQKMVRNN
jgi:hypothetical protein